MKLNIQLFGASASVQSAKYDGRYLKLTVTETETSIENNTSTIYWKFESIGGSSSYYTIYNYGVYVNGSQVYDGTSGDKTKNYSNHSLPVTKGSKDGYITVEHNADGTAADITFSLHGKVYKSGTETHNGTLTLTTIPRASQPRLSSSNVNMGSAVTIYTDRVSTTFTHTIRYWFGNENGTIGTNVTDSVSWTPPLTLANQMPNATSGSGTIYCDTYSGGTLIGTKTVGITLNVPTNVVPTISNMALQENGDVPSNWGVYVQNKSKIKVTYSASGAYSSTISSYTTAAEGYTYINNGITTNYIRNSGNITINGSVVDSRGRQATTSQTPYIYPYANPTISTAQIQRCDINGNIDNNGEYMFISYGASISSCNGNNTSTYKVGYRTHNVGSYTYVPLATNVVSFSASGMLYTDGIYAADRGSGTKVEFSSLNTYDIQFYVADYFMVNDSNVQQLDTGFDLMNFNASGKSMAIGKVSEAGANEEKLEIGIDTEIEGDLSVSGIIDGTIDGTDVWTTFKTLSGNARLNLQQILTAKANDGLAKYNRLGGIDFNDLVEYGSGLYSIVGTAHSPGANDQWYQVVQIVMPDANYVQQYASYMFGGKTIWIRTGANGSYGDWIVISNDYRMDELPIGTWTSGQTLYRRAFDGNLNSNGRLPARINVGGTIVKIEGIVRSVYNNRWVIGSHYPFDNGYDSCFVLGGTEFDIETGGYFANCYWYAIVEYVKQ